MMELKKVGEWTKIRLGDNTVIVKEVFEIGHYEIERTTETYEDGTQKEWFRTARDTDAEFCPEIEFQSVGGEREFVAITPGSWEVTVDELKQLIAGYQEALEAIGVLTEAFIKKGE